MKIRLMTMASVAALTVVLAGCGSSSGGSGDSDSGGEYHVVVLGGLSAEGVLADNANTSVNAAKASVDYANDNGGVNGEKVTITVIDDAGDPTTAVSKLREEIAKDKPDLVLNSGPSTVADATLPILNQNNILSFNMGPTATSADPSKFPLNFDLAAGASEQLSAFPPYLQEKGYKKVAIIHGNSAYGETYGPAVESVLKPQGYTITADKEYDVAALDMTPQLEAIKATNPDVLIVDAYGAPLGYLLKGVTKLGWDIPMIGNTSVSATSITGAEPPDGVVGTDEAKNLVMEVPSASAYDPSNTAVNDAVQRMLKYGPIKTSLVLAYNYDALPLVMAAADSAKSTDPQKLAAALVDPTVLQSAKTALFQDYGFTTTQHAPQGLKDGYVFIPPSVLKDGQFH